MIGIKCKNKHTNEIKENVLPKKLNKIEFGEDFDKEIKENILPKSLKKIIFPISYTNEIKENVLPDNMVYVKYGNKKFYISSN